MFIRLFFVISFLLVAFPVSAEEMITNFDTKIEINKNSSINVTETIDYDFGENAIDRHGIYRDIIYKYKARGGNFNLRINEISVLDSKGYDYNFAINNKGKYKSIKIGDADVLVSGKKRYVIKYQVNRAINFFNDYDELYWNATGDEWKVPIKQSKTIIILPDEITDSEVKTECFSGIAGSKNKCSYTRRNYKNKDKVDSIIFINEKLNPKEGLTVVIGMPKGIIEKQSIFTSLLYIVMDNWILGIPFLVFFVMFYLWWTRGRDPKGRETIVAQFDIPDNLTPLEVGILINEKVDNFEVSAQIIDFAVRGYIRIIKVEKDGIFKSGDYLIEKLKDDSDLKNKFEQILFKSLFKKEEIHKGIKALKGELKTKGLENNFLAKIFLGSFEKTEDEISKNIEDEINKKEIIKLSDLENTFFKNLIKVKKGIYVEMVNKKYFNKNPQTVRRKFIGASFAVALIAFFILTTLQNIYAVLSIIISVVIITLFGLAMPVKTKKGVLAREHILGLKKYLEVAEKDRINFHNAPEKNPKHFEKLLPIAMVLKVEKKWAKQF
ncbi:DUF2207 domain-containing protein, partial [Candidatus Parcubacteria bacterium]|nr:DUF2207 domain-containing protein [Candidatus Parcubacteria bacterium]